jgi:hypothetical protein
VAEITEQENQEIDQAIADGTAVPAEELKGRELFSAQARVAIKGEQDLGFFDGEPQDLSFFDEIEPPPAVDLDLERKGRLVALFNNDIQNTQSYIDQIKMGDTSGLQTLQEQREKMNSFHARQDVIGVMNNQMLSDSEKVQQLVQLANNSKGFRFNDVVNVTMAEQQMASATSPIQQQEVINQFIEESREGITEFAKRERQNRITTTDTPHWDFASIMLLPGTFALPTYRVLNEVFPEIVTEDDFLAAVAPGKEIQEYKNYINDLWITDQEKAKEKIIELIDAIERSTLFGRENFGVKYNMFTTLIDEIEDRGEFDRALNSAFGVLDIWMVGDLVRQSKHLMSGVTEGLGGIKTVDKKYEYYRDVIANADNNKTPGSPSDMLDKASPENSKQIHEAAFEELDQRVLEETLGDDYVNLVTSHLVWRKNGERIKGLSPDLQPSLSTRLENKRITATMSPEDIDVAKSRLSDRAAEQLQTRAETHLNKSTFRVLGDGIEADLVIGRTKARGWKSIDEIQPFLDDYPQQYVQDPKILVKDKRTGGLEHVDDVPEEFRAKDYYVSVHQKDIVLPSDTAYQRTIEGGVAGSIAKLADKSSFMAKMKLYGENVTDDATANAYKALTTILKPFTSLPARDGSRQAVASILDDGDYHGKWFNPMELSEIWAHRKNKDKLINAYYAVVAHNRIARRMINDSMVRTARSRGMKEVVIPDVTSTPMLGTPRDILPKDITQVYDPRTQKMISLTPEFRKELDNKGGQYIQLNESFILPEKGNLPLNVTWVLSDGTTLKEVRSNLLPDIDGYLNRQYDSHFKVVERVKGRDQNGAISHFDKTVVMARSRQEGERAIAKLMTDEENAEKIYKTVELDELRIQENPIDVWDAEFRTNSAELFSGHRGPELKDLNGDRIVVPVQERLNALTARASRATHMDFWIEKQIDEFMHLYPEFLVEGKLPLRDQIPSAKGADIVSRRRHDEAVAHLERIKLLAGIAPSKLAMSQEAAAIRFADMVEDSRILGDKYGTKVAKYILDKKNGSFFDPFKQIAFNMYIAGNLPRQLFLQVNQASIYLSEDHAMKYFFSGKGIQEWWGLMLGMMNRDGKRWDVMAPKLAKASGMTTDEYIEFIDTIRNSGMFANIDSHAFTDGLMMKMQSDKQISRARGLADDVLRASKGGLKVLRKGGFDFSEASHLAFGILVQRNRFIKDNPGKAGKWNSPENYSEIFGRARSLASNMTKTGQLGFQTRGALGTMMQFQSHNWKMRQRLIPPGPRITPDSGRVARAYHETFGKLANKEFTQRQHLKMLLIQASIYGPAGFLGVTNAYDALKEKFRFEEVRKDNPEWWDAADQLMKEGMFGTAVNGMAQIADEGEFFDSALDVSGSMAPMAGVTQMPMSRMFQQQAIGVVDLRQIPGAAASKQVLDALGVISALGIAEFNSEYYDSETGLPADTNTALAMLETVASLIPTFGNLQRARAELAIEQIVTRSGDPVVQASASEIKARIFGINSTAERQAYRILDMFPRRLSTANDSELDDETEHAKWLYQTAVKLIQKQTTGNQVADFKTVEETVNHLAQFSRLMYSDPESYDYLRNEAIPNVIEEHYILSQSDGPEAPNKQDELFDNLERNTEKTVHNMESVFRAIENMEDTPRKAEWLEEIKRELSN